MVAKGNPQTGGTVSFVHEVKKGNGKPDLL
jgi:hypothetical protein